MVSPLCVAHKIVRMMLCLGAPPRYSLVVDEDAKKPNNHTREGSSLAGKIILFMEKINYKII